MSASFGDSHDLESPGRVLKGRGSLVVSFSFPYDETTKLTSQRITVKSSHVSLTVHSDDTEGIT